MPSYIVIIAIVLAINGFAMTANGFALIGMDNSAIKVSDKDLSKNIVNRDLKEHQTTVGHFARHGLCRNHVGKRKLYTAMKMKLCDISLTMIQSVVMDLCRRKNYMLDKWVEELFDIDGNGYISHFEKQYYS